MVVPEPSWQSASIQEWLQYASKELCVALASRMALRAVPRVLPTYNTMLLLWLCRAGLNSAVEAKFSKDGRFSVKGARISSMLERIIDASQGPLAIENMVARIAVEAASGSAYRCLQYSSQLGQEFVQNFEVDKMSVQHLWKQGLYKKASDVDRLAGNVKLHLDHFEFWKRWHDAFISGRPLQWELQRRVALIPDDVWEEGAEAVAKRINEIEGEFAERSELDEARLNQTVSQILMQPMLFRDAAECTWQQIETAIAAYKENFANSLPDGFRTLEKLPPVYANISQILDRGAGDAEKDALRAEITRLRRVISELERTLREERAAFRARLLSSEEAAQARSYGERLQTTLTCITLLGGLGMGAAMFFGWDKDDFQYQALKAKMQGLAEDLKNAKASPVVLEHDIQTDGPKFERPPEK